MSLTYSFTHLVITHSFVPNPVLVGIRDIAVTETASDSPHAVSGWGWGQGAPSPTWMDGRIEQRGGFPEEGTCDLRPKG